MEYSTLLEGAQRYMSQNHSDLTESANLRPYLEKYVRDCKIVTAEQEINSAVDFLNSEMCEYSVLTPLLAPEASQYEEININSWDDITVTTNDGKRVKVGGFRSPEHAVDIVKRLLHHSGIVIDSATPTAQGQLPNNMRITALMYPITDKDVGIAASIRRLNPSKLTGAELVSEDFASCEMYEFISACTRYGVSFAVAGATSSGKTTLLNAILTDIPDEKRIITIESGSRELSLVRRKDGKVCNNVVHLLSRPSENPAYDVSQEDLVVSAMRLTPNIICVGEIRDVEAHAAIEAAQTGHTVVTTVHARTPETAHDRIADLSRKKYPTDFKTILSQTAKAFPVIICTRQLADNRRRVTEITECEVVNGELMYRQLFQFHITKNEVDKDGNSHIDGHFEKVNNISDSLCERLTAGGIPTKLLDKFVN